MLAFILGVSTKGFVEGIAEALRVFHTCDRACDWTPQTLHTLLEQALLLLLGVAQCLRQKLLSLNE